MTPLALCRRVGLYIAPRVTAANAALGVYRPLA